MSQVRSRLNKKDSTDRVVSHANLYAKPTFKSSINKLLSFVPENLRNYAEMIFDDFNKAPYSEEKKIQAARIFTKFSRENENLIEELSKQSELFKEMAENPVPMPNGKNTYQAPAYLPHLLKTIGISRIASSAPVLAFLLPFLPAAAAEIIKVNGGIPPGGMDLCGPLNIWCHQSYLTNEQQQILAQISTVLQVSVNSKNNNPLYLFVCLNDEKIGSAIANKFFAEGISNGTENCIANSIMYSGVTATTQVTNLPPNSCPSLQNIMNPIYNGCMNEINSIGMIAGLSALGVVVLAGIIGGGYFAAKTKCFGACDNS